MKGTIINGDMTYKQTTIKVTDVEAGERDGRNGWWATIETGHPMLQVRMFYPTDMFTFTPDAEVEP